MLTASARIMCQIPGDRFPYTFEQIGARPEPELLLSQRGIQAAAWLSVRLAGIPHDSAFVANNVCDSRGEIPDGDLHAAAEVHGVGCIVMLGSQKDGYRGVANIQELACGRTISQKTSNLPERFASTNLRIIAGMTCEVFRSKLSAGP